VQNANQEYRGYRLTCLETNPSYLVTFGPETVGPLPGNQSPVSAFSSNSFSASPTPCSTTGSATSSARMGSWPASWPSIWPSACAGRAT
jgi:hypothetical protein